MIMSIKINIGVNKKVGLPDYGSAGGHCNIEIEADNSILDNAGLFLQRVKNAYELARQSVEEELAHHRLGNATSNGASPSRRTEQFDKEPAPRQEYRQEYRSDNSSGGNRYVASPKQQQFIAGLMKGVKGLDWRTLDRYCDSKFGKVCSQLSSKEASALIEDLKEAKSGGGLPV
jgi:hypothetical protein